MKNGNVLDPKLHVYPTGGCAAGQSCAPFAEAFVDNMDKTNTASQKPPMRFVPTDDLVARVGMSEETGSFVSPSLLRGYSFWEPLVDYATLRTDTAWGQVDSQHYLMNTDHILHRNKHRCTFNRCTTARKVAFTYGSAYKPVRKNFDFETGSGQCYATLNNSGNDMNSNALYRRRHFIRLEDEIAIPDMVLFNGKTASELIPEIKFVILKGKKTTEESIADFVDSGSTAEETRRWNIKDCPYKYKHTFAQYGYITNPRQHYAEADDTTQCNWASEASAPSSKEYQGNTPFLVGVSWKLGQRRRYNCSGRHWESIWGP